LNPLGGRFGGKYPSQSGHKALKKSLEARMAGILPTKPLHQEDSREFVHKAVEKALGANAKSCPKGLFYALAARLAGILTIHPRGF
jgi:hypothetical protein